MTVVACLDTFIPWPLNMSVKAWWEVKMENVTTLIVFVGIVSEKTIALSTVPKPPSSLSIYGCKRWCLRGSPLMVFQLVLPSCFLYRIKRAGRGNHRFRMVEIRLRRKWLGSSLYKQALTTSHMFLSYYDPGPFKWGVKASYWPPYGSPCCIVYISNECGATHQHLVL